MDKIKVGIIGTGYLGKLHTKLIGDVDNADLIGVYDKDFSAAELVALEFKTRVFPELDDLLQYVNAVIIVASTKAHYELVKATLNFGVHVFVEKPITSEIWEAEEIVKLADDKNLKLQVGHIERFNGALVSLEKFNLNPMFIQTDRLAQFNPRGADVAVVLDLMIHDIDIILSLVKSEVKHISASGVNVVSDSLDIANARIEFENGAVANVTASRISQKKMRKMRIFQRDAYIAVDFNSGVSEIYRLVSPDDKSLKDFISFGEMGIGDRKKAVIYEQPEQKEINALKYEQQLFINAIVNNETPIVSGKDGLKALKVAEMIITKIKESKFI
ncbi:MAG: Gfo/Idh/MocA family oxidoreductase [Bacteroidetes bacterium]|nr:Gfo/Idh/MocA family oxidoreductase [Bacteroidota bacterium]MBU1113513.1 Gfo/Idh/MocA family oxidoreductase [Bacteroidota bacterium]MBU1797037.1 Gfo/Idh/MocA family oxidoreductase [Bacteroidota bacterium]